MRLKSIVCFSVFVLIFTMIALPVSAHEMWIEVKDLEGEFRVEVFWGHIRDYLDSASHEDYELFVRYPDGSVEELETEGIGVQARAFINPREEGEYVFWALRNPGTFTPDGGLTTLSVQLAKSVFQYGSGPGTAAEPVDILLEIIPEVDLTDFGTGQFKGAVLMEGTPAESAIISAYGPQNRALEGISDSDGTFQLNLDLPGIWLIKANVADEDEGTHNGEDYAMISRTTTLLIDTGSDVETAASASGSGGSAEMMVLLLIAGILLGAAAVFLYQSKRA